MMSRARSARAEPDAMIQADCWRRPLTGPARLGGMHKEWMHFCVALPGRGHLLVNLNVCERTVGESCERVPRLITLGWNEAWVGEIIEFGPAQVRGDSGELRAQLAENRLDWKEGVFQLSLRTALIDVDLALCPLTPPTPPTRLALGNGHSLHWVVVPRLLANGWVRIGSGKHLLRNAFAYHDHNWGEFRWGGQLAWEWGFVHPRDAGCPWTLVLARVSGNGGHRAISQSLLLWRDGKLSQLFQDRELRFRVEHERPARRAFTLPRVASLLAPGTSSGVPARYGVYGTALGDEVNLDFHIDERARVGLPSETNPFRISFLNEASGSARVQGQLGSEAFAFDGSGMLEFMRG
jgi:hypothetical protein